jgi:hypothetical protein
MKVGTMPCCPPRQPLRCAIVCYYLLRSYYIGGRSRKHFFIPARHFSPESMKNGFLYTFECKEEKVNTNPCS